VGAYFEDRGAAPRGEMHIRQGRYIGVAPLAAGLTNVCLVQPANGRLADPAGLLRQIIDDEPVLRDRFGGRPAVGPPLVLGPLAVDVRPHAVDGLIFAGDAAGFVDPMTGDGMRFAVRGGELAAVSALHALEHGWDGVHARLAAVRRREFAAKWRFNRALRALVSVPAALHAIELGARFAPGPIRSLIARAGDCDIAQQDSPPPRS
jgi:flavin-dependent dehydrogenase